MKFADFVCFEAIIPELSSTVRDSVIAELVSALSKAGRLKRSQREGIIKAVIKRENEASTGMGKGVAVPHVKDGSLKEVIAAVGRSSVGIEFASLDKQPVYSVILLLSPADKPDKHLQAMETIFKNLQNEQFRKFLRQSQSAAEIRDLLREADEEPFFLRV
ncbi:MAG: PTS sugar transporter subunit IIA [Planctomycetota bacterium]|jgi:mannitol/fructose-specific phosphotransferase system IIA component (Ntr-type)